MSYHDADADAAAEAYEERIREQSEQMDRYRDDEPPLDRRKVTCGCGAVLEQWELAEHMDNHGLAGADREG